MRGVHHRAPGPIPALLDADDVVCELIVDGEHLHPAIVRRTHQLLGPRRVALITDAILATGLPDGAYEFSDQDVTVRHGRAELADGSSLAGSTLTLDAAVRNTVDAGVPLADAIESVTATPARVLGLHDRGALRTGTRADLVVLDAALEVTGVMRGGAWLIDPTS
jgi:N-acetylglucosamine-6-phosphate deacetylase